jgi:hypothetical protein
MMPMPTIHFSICVVIEDTSVNHLPASCTTPFFVVSVSYVKLFSEDIVILLSYTKEQRVCIRFHFKLGTSDTHVMNKAKQSRYTPWWHLGGEEV